MISLFPQEHILSQDRDSYFILTTHRLYQEERNWGSTKTKSIMLEHITSCESINKKYFFWLMLAGLCLLAFSADDIAIIGMIGPVLFTALFFLTKTSMIKIASPTSAIFVYVKGMSQNEIYNIVEKIEHAKIKRIDSLK